MEDTNKRTLTGDFKFDGGEVEMKVVLSHDSGVDVNPVVELLGKMIKHLNDEKQIDAFAVDDE